MFPAGMYVSDVALLAIIQRAVTLIGEQVRKTENGVQRRAQLVAHRGEKLILELASALRFFLGVHEELLCPFAFCDIPNGAGHQNALFGMQRAQTDLDREFGSVPTRTEQLQACTHWPRVRIPKKIVSMRRMSSPETFWHQFLNRLSQQLIPLVAKELLGLRIYQNDLAFAVDNDHGIRRRFEQP